MTIIALDYDNTASADLDLWRAFIAKAQERKHYVMIVTFRHASFGIADIERDYPGIEIVTTEGTLKRRYLEENGFPVPTIWIDDMPELIGSRTDSVDA